MKSKTQKTITKSKTKKNLGGALLLTRGKEEHTYAGTVDLEVQLPKLTGESVR